MLTAKMAARTKHLRSMDSFRNKPGWRTILSCHRLITQDRRVHTMPLRRILSDHKQKGLLSSWSHQIDYSHFSVPLPSQVRLWSTFETASLGWSAPLSLSPFVTSSLYCSLFLLLSPAFDLSTHNIPRILFKNNHLPAFSRNWPVFFPFPSLRCIVA
jgi:hypothetical protein